MATPTELPADRLRECMDIVDRLAGLIAGEDQPRAVLIAQALANEVDGFLARPGDDGLRHARSLLVRAAEPHVARARTGRRAAPSGGPSPVADSIYSDPIFLRNAQELMRDRERIVGGTPTAEYPDCVAIGSATQWCCTGTLVAPNVVVTAAHCVAGGCANRVFVGDDVHFLGDGQVIPVQEAVVHPGYRRPKRTQDLAVLILQIPADVTPRAVAPVEAVRASATVRLAGFGNTDVYSSGGYGRRRMVDVPIASSDSRHGDDPGTEFVAGAPFLDRDSCNGDSGGPAYVQADGHWYLAGATSRATASSVRPCGDGGVYTMVATYERWMRSIPGGMWN
ncbi:MAG TPA: serine protease [Jiangellales bacterium]|nr:serine protease [Jiangellales bacterium]